MKKIALVVYSILLVFSLFAAPPKGGAAEPVNEGYPAWTGVTPKNFIQGRVLMSDADLRQRLVTIVIEFDAAKAEEQLEATGNLSNENGFGNVIGFGSVNWESVQIPRDVLVIYVAHNAKDHKLVTDVMKGKDAVKFPGITSVARNNPPIYEGVTFEGAPDNGGKFPFVFVMGHEGKEPLFKGEYEDKKTLQAIRKVMAAQKKKMSEDELTWRPYYGYVAEPKFFHDTEKAIAKGKPLDVVEAKLLKSVRNSDPEKAKEAQLLYDGLAQTRSDMIWLTQCSCVSSPHVAAYNMGLVLKYWPKSKKAMSSVADKLKANSAAQPLIKMYPRIMQWADPNFTCKNAGEAKKIVAELQKMKKTIKTIAEDSSNINAQNGALMVDGMLDELITVMPSKVPQK